MHLFSDGKMRLSQPEANASLSGNGVERSGHVTSRGVAQDVYLLASHVKNMGHQVVQGSSATVTASFAPS